MLNLNSKASPAYYEQIILNFLESETFKVFYDIGVGPKTEYLTIKNKFPATRFYGLEANPNTFREIEHIFPGIVLPMAVSESGETVKYVVHEQNVMASGLIPYDNARDGQEILVPSITLDNFDKRFEAADGILLWMDIEGYELKALQSGMELLRSGRVKLINLEVRPRWNGKSGGCTELEIDEFLAGFGYSKIFVYNHYPQSRHHDAIYLLRGHSLPDSASPYVSLYEDNMALMNSASGMLDLSLGMIDCVIAIEERERKIAYLRSKLSSPPIAKESASIVERDSNVGPVLCRSNTRMEMCLLRSKWHDIGVEFFVRRYQQHLFPFVDVGANIGIFSILAADIAHDSDHVFSFEPDSTNNSILKANLALREGLNITVEKCAVSDTTGVIKVGEIDCGLAKKSAINTIDVPCITIDEYFKNLEAPRFVKIDIEGAEIDVIKGMKGVIERSLPIIQMEFSYRDLRSQLSTLFEIIKFDSYFIEILLPSDLKSCAHIFNSLAFPSKLITHIISGKRFYSATLTCQKELGVILDYMVEETSKQHSVKWEVCFVPRVAYDGNKKSNIEGHFDVEYS